MGVSPSDYPDSWSTGLPTLFPCSEPASKNTYVILERALDWQPGSIDMILAGSEPTEDGAEEPQDEPKAVALNIRDAAIRRAG